MLLRYRDSPIVGRDMTKGRRIKMKAVHLSDNGARTTVSHRDLLLKSGYVNDSRFHLNIDTTR